MSTSHLPSLYPYFESEEQRDGFHTWAFGPEPAETGFKLMEYWNAHHGHLLTLHPDDSVHESLLKMIAIYRELH